MIDDETDQDSTQDHSEARATIWASEMLLERIDDDVDWRYGSRSEWFREAARLRLLLTDELDREGVGLPADPDDREATIREILFRGVRAVDLDDPQLPDETADADADANADE